LSSVGTEDIPVVKFSETIGKGTLPGPFKVVRSEESLKNKKTILFSNEEGVDMLETYFDGTQIWEPFGPAQDDNFLDIKNRKTSQMKNMPLSLETEYNNNYPASDKVMLVKQELLHKYAPNK